MANPEHENHKIGLISELLVRLRLNEYGVNTGSVDKDTGTDIVLFWNGNIRTGQVKTSRNSRPDNYSRVVDVLFQVSLSEADGRLSLDSSEINCTNIKTRESFDLCIQSIPKLFSLN